MAPEVPETVHPAGRLLGFESILFTAKANFFYSVFVSMVKITVEG
jgi:hypothetical protein